MLIFLGVFPKRLSPPQTTCESEALSVFMHMLNQLFEGFFHLPQLHLSSEALGAPGSPPWLGRPPNRAFGTDESFYLDIVGDGREQGNNVDIRFKGSYIEILHFKRHFELMNIPFSILFLCSVSNWVNFFWWILYLYFLEIQLQL